MKEAGRVTVTFDPTAELLTELDEFIAMANQYWSRDEREKAGYSRWARLSRTSVIRVALRQLLTIHTGNGKNKARPTTAAKKRSAANKVG